jgi:hypothetical protein
LAVLAIWLTTTAYVVWRLPALPTLTNDSASYIGLGPTRAPAYGWFLHIFQAVTGAGPEYAHLPLAQTLLIAFALLGFAVQLAGLVRSGIAAAAIILVWAHTGTFEASRYVMSEGLFLPALLAGITCSMAHARSGGWASLAGASVAFSLALLIRTAGAVLLAIPLLLVVLDGRLGLAAMLRRSGLVIGLAVALMLAGMAANQARNGHFEIGSNSGTSLLGKAMLLLRADQEQDPTLARMAPLAAEARVAVAAAPDFAASLRAQSQAYEELRWPSFFPMAEQASPGMAADGGREASIAAGHIAKAVIATDLTGYFRLVARDWAGLILYPNFWPIAWKADSSPHPFFAHCATDAVRCWTFFRLEVPRYYGVAMLGTSLLGLVATAALLLGWGSRAWRRRLAPPERLMVALALVAQASLAATALFEAGLWRYTLAVHVVDTALIIWLAARLMSRGRPA